jgi:hypothetical protein
MQRSALHRERRLRAQAPPSKRSLALGEVCQALSRAKPKCTLYAFSYSEHVLQIYAGLYALHEAGVIALEQRFAADDLVRRLGKPVDAKFFSNALNGLFVDVDGAGLVFFDVRDGINYYADIADDLVLYAKRSFRQGAFQPARARFVPLGLNYSIYPDRTRMLELERTLKQLELSMLSLKRLAIALVRIFPRLGQAIGVPTVGSVRAEPDPGAPPRAIFLARAWEPKKGVLREETVKHLNDFRAQCIRVLRSRFGSDFIGGFARDSYSCRLYPDCVVSADVSTRRRDYLKLLRSYPVCIATTGLFDSIGWKFGEYVALSKAIVSEVLRFELPGPFAPGENYLAFRTAQACVEQVEELFRDDEARARMMRNNSEYYAEYGSPHAVVARALHAALEAR